MSEVNFFLTCAVLLGRLLPQLKGELTGSFKCFEYYSVARDKKKIGEMQGVYMKERLCIIVKDTLYTVYSVDLCIGFLKLLQEGLVQSFKCVIKEGHGQNTLQL